MKSALLLFALLFNVIAFAQTDAEIDAISESTCTCLKSKDIKTGDMNQIQVELGICMLAAMSENKVDIDVADLEGIEKVGERVGFQLALTCPHFLDIIGTFAEEDPAGFNSLMEDDDYERTEFSFGSVLEINSDDFVTLKIQNDNGRKEVFYWFEHFNGAQLLENNGAGVVNKNVFVEYKIIEYYSPKLEDYTDLKVLVSLSLD